MGGQTADLFDEWPVYRDRNPDYSNSRITRTRVSTPSYGMLL